MSSAETLVATPDPNWWRVVFTEAEHEALEKRFEEIVAETASGEDDGEEPIAVVVMVARSKFYNVLRALVMASAEDLDVDDIGVAFAQHYFDDSTIPPDDEASSDARQFYSPYDQDDEEEE